MKERLDDLLNRKEAARNAGSERSVERQHAKGKMLARERIDYLLDPGSFHELDMLARHRAHESGLEEQPYTDGVITGWGTVDGRKVFVFSQDFTVFGGALGEVFAEKIHKVMDLALSTGAPMIGLNDGAVPEFKRVWSALRHMEASSAETSCRRASSPRFPHPRPVRRWCGVLASDDRLHLHGSRIITHVHHRTRCGEDGDG